jgi:hypothetical protein
VNLFYSFTALSAYNADLNFVAIGIAVNSPIFMANALGQISQKTRFCIDIQAITPKLNKNLNKELSKSFFCHNLEIERYRLKHFVGGIFQ